MKSAPTVIAWCYRHHNLHAELCDNVEEAVSFLAYGDDNVEHASVGIEIDGEMVPFWHDLPACLEREAKEEAEEQRRREAPKPVGSIALCPPQSKEFPGSPEAVTVAWFYDDAELQLAIADYEAAFGDRVRVSRG